MGHIGDLQWAVFCSSNAGSWGDSSVGKLLSLKAEGSDFDSTAPTQRQLQKTSGVVAHTTQAMGKQTGGSQGLGGLPA